MATSKTGSFYLTETVIIPANQLGGTRTQGSIDLGAYVDVATGQAIAIEYVDFVVQSGTDMNMSPNEFLVDSGSIGFQLTDLNPGVRFVRADNQSLVASGALVIDTPNNVASHQVDLYPDNYGNASLSEAFMVVNDQLYLVAGNDKQATNEDLYVTARIRCRVVKLGSKDWMAIAIQSTAADN